MTKSKVLLILLLAISILVNGVLVYALATISYSHEPPKALTEEEINIVQKAYQVLLGKDLFPIDSYLQKIEKRENEIVLHFMVLQHLQSHAQVFGGFEIMDGCSSFRFNKEYELLSYEICG